MARSATVGNPNIILIAARLYFGRTVRQLPGTVIFATTLALGTPNLPGGANCARVAWSVKELEDDSDGTGGPCEFGGARSDCDGGGDPLSKSV